MDNISRSIQIKVLIIIILVLLSSLLILFLVADPGVRTFENDNFKIVYETNWKVKENEDNKVRLLHKSGSEYIIDLIDLEGEHRRDELSVIIEDILDQVEKDNPTYRLVNKEETVISKNEYEAYRYLYETDDLQSMITICKKNDKVYIINYNAEHVKFDILLDSVLDMTWNFEILR